MESEVMVGSSAAAGEPAAPVEPIGLLLTNLGSPDAPTRAALRRYLAEFLSDPRVIELPRILWKTILHGVILNVRPQRSAKLYQRVWSDEGAPLIVIGRRQQAALETELGSRFDPPIALALGMRYGSPSIRSALESLRARGCTRILVLPLYPQYFSGTSGSTFDAVASVLTTWRRVPALRMITDYHDDPGYVDALARSVRELWEQEGEPDRLLLSFHGIPVRYEQAGDPYPRQCRRTANLLAEALRLPYERWLLSFQSRFGREKWLEPYTDETLKKWGASGIKNVDVVCPGFAADCLETLEEIALLNRGFFLDAGGERFRYIPALNDRPHHIRALADLVERHLQGW
jgi:protoporphyrin/coproporphyrin ferrochelatase